MDFVLREMVVKYKAPRKKKISIMDSPAEIYKYFYPIIAQDQQEHFVGVFLNNRNHIAAWKTIGIGTMSEIYISPKDVFRNALIAGATSIILVHNHPSGVTNPSEEDISITKRLIDSAKILDIKILDHVIIGYGGFSSFKELGYIK